MAIFVFDEYLNVPRVAELLNIPKSTTYQLVQRGVIPSIRIGADIRIPSQQLVDYLASLKRPHTRRVTEQK